MAPTLYCGRGSPPVRAVLMTAEAIDLTLNKIEINFFRNDHLKNNFLQLNPQRTVPTLVDDDGFAIWDSHAIMVYLVAKYAKDDSLYPRDLKKRAVVNQRLFFESGVVFLPINTIAKYVINQGRTTIDEREKDLIIDAYGFLNKFLEGNVWVAGDYLSIADFSLLPSVSDCKEIIPVDPEKFPNVVEWLKRCEKLPEYDINRKGLEESARVLQARLKKRY